MTGVNDFKKYFLPAVKSGNSVTFFKTKLKVSGEKHNGKAS